MLERRGPPAGARPLAPPGRHRRGRARRATARHRRRDRLPDRARVPVAVRDVRPVAVHDRRPTRPRGAIPAQIDAARAGAPARRRHRRAGSSSTTPAASSIRGRCRPSRLRRHRRRRSPVRTRRSSSHIRRSSVRASSDCSTRCRAASGGGRAAQLEVAMGLETAHPDALERLNKRMTLDGFSARPARSLDARRRAACVPADLAAVRGPRGAGLPGCCAPSIAAIDCGASVVSLVPTRAGNGAIEALAAAGGFAPPTLEDIERSLALALSACAGPGPSVRGPLGPRAVRSMSGVLRRRAARGCSRMNLEQRVRADGRLRAPADDAPAPMTSTPARVDRRPTSRSSAPASPARSSRWRSRAAASASCCSSAAAIRASRSASRPRRWRIC